MNAARVIFPGFWFGRSNIEDACKLAEAGVGGFCVFGGTAAEIENFTKQMRGLTPYNKILICADYEDGLGGEVEGLEILPSNMAAGASGDEDIARKKGLITARQARSIGVDWVFAPVVDLANNPENPAVNARSFGSDAALVLKMATAFVQGLSQGGVLNTLKYFPGYGAVNADGASLPFITKSFDDLFEQDLLPYRNLLRLADSIMLGGAVLPVIDAEEPSALSEKTVRGLLRQRLSYKGCVITDIFDFPGQRAAAAKALKAGVDVIMAPSDPFGIIEEIRRLEKEDYTWKDIFIDATAAQEILLTKNNTVEVRAPEQTLFKSAYSADAAPKCITHHGGKIYFTSGDNVNYLIFDAPRSFKESPFSKEMKALGINLEEYKGGAAENLLIISCSGPDGKIDLTLPEKREILSALNSSKNSVMISFGSPFVHTDFLAKINSHYFCYCANEDFQTAMPKILLGQEQCRGILPVKLNHKI